MADLITNFKIKIMNYKLFKAVSPLLLICFCLAQCKKTSSAQEDQLPPATQTGANTFGCLVNGKVYIPKGYAGTGTPNPRIIFDIGLDGLPYLQIIAKQFGQSNLQEGSFILFTDSLISIGTHNIYTNKKQIGYGSRFTANCGILPDDNVQFKTGIIQITKYDRLNGIISGIFNFKIKPSDCDTLSFTNGRFDFKL